MLQWMSTIDEIENNYKETMRILEQKLAERKKMKIDVEYDPKSAFIENGIPLYSNESVNLNASICDDKSVCEICKLRMAVYKSHGIKLCASCLHKNSIGISAKKTKYLEEYKKYTGRDAVICTCLSEIDKEYIAVVYGDGNNMGQIIQNFTQITEMMEFSDKVKITANKAVFETMADIGIDRFEVVGLGGDDVFVIVSGKKAIDFSIGLIERYNAEFRKTEEELKENKNPFKSTMSVGVCIAKTDTPIRIMLEIAEEKLKEAKEQAKKDNVKGCDEGSLAFTVLNDPTDSADHNENRFNAMTTLQPYSTKSAHQIIDFARKLSVNNSITELRNLYDAYCISDSPEEAELFYKYQNAKAKAGEKIEQPFIWGYDLDGGLYYRDGKAAFIWRDIIELQKFID